MQAISVRQPWAWAIARGHSTLSNEDLPAVYRGPLLIHASMRVDLKSSDSVLMHAAGWDPGDPLAALGAVIAVAELTDVCGSTFQGDGTCGCGPWAEPRAYHWRLAGVRPLPRPVFTLGRPGLWEPDPPVLGDVRAMLAATEFNRCS
ncbi:MAG: hypothetical protein JWO67_5717 [Streptosporangiaceae bacterium]|nr:hypothetical protein [Streptosporangiaceae bacterium]